MMVFSKAMRRRLSSTAIPGTADTQQAVRDYMARADLSVDEFAERIGYGRSSLGHFLYGRYKHVAASDARIRAACWELMRRRPLGPRVRQHGRLFETENVRRMRTYFRAALQGEISLIYGPPGTQKTFALEHLVCDCNRDKNTLAIYIYASIGMTPLALLKRIGREAGVRVGYSVREKVTSNVLDAFSGQDKPPAIIIDEAQHLTVAALEAARELHDRCGCGLVIAGSHDLYEGLLRDRAKLEQWLSRIDHKEPLPGLLEDEVREIAARELGNGQPAKLGEKQFRALLDACRVDDVFACSLDGRPAPRKYLSVRRLVKVLEQYKVATKQKAGAA